MGYVIKKVKLVDRDLPEIHYLESSTYGEPECKLSGTERSPKLCEAMQKMMRTGIEWGKLDKDEWDQFGKVSGVVLKHIDGDLGVTLVLRGDFPDPDSGANYGINITTPYLNPDRLTTHEHIALCDICAEAENYLKGQPLQLELVA